jgi:hypothetical protein
MLSPWCDLIFVGDGLNSSVEHSGEFRVKVVNMPMGAHRSVFLGDHRQCKEVFVLAAAGQYPFEDLFFYEHFISL